jgi:hypothetical protein
MPTDKAQLNELLGQFAIDPDMTGHVAPTDRSHPNPIGTWTIDPTLSSVSLAWRKLRLWTIYRSAALRRVLHLDELPPVGVIRAAC